MIVKILSSASNDFHGVKYNDKKMESGAGELMTMENFPDGFDENPKQEAVRNYFKSISKWRNITFQRWCYRHFCDYQRRKRKQSF